jgi:branched-chain amino acid transport system permease protein
VTLFLQLVLNGIVNGSHYALLGVGFGLIFGTTNLVHFAYGPVYTTAAYATWAAVALLGLPLLAAVPFGLLAAAALGVATYLLLYRPFERRAAPTFVVLVASLGFFILLENVIAILFGTDIKVIPNLPSHVVLVGPFFLTDLQIYQVCAIALIGGALALFLNFTSYGKAVLAMTDNREMARIVGIDTVKVSVVVFAIGSAISAVAAVLILMKDGAQPTMGFGAVFIAFVAVVVGGIGSLRGAVLGGYLLGLVENVGMIRIPTEWQSSIAFVVLFLVLIFRPQGLLRGS